MTIGRQEWLFEQNPVDPRRVSAWLIDHDTHVIVLHEESDVRNALGLNGWANVLTLRIRFRGAGRPQVDGEVSRHRRQPLPALAAPDTKPGIADAWWNEELLLAGAFVLRDPARTRVTIETLRPGVDAQLLRAPALRFKSYKVVDRAEWLEGH